jgi:pilus assembly protein CpaB
MKNRRRTLGILLAVLLAGAGTAALVSYVQSAKDEALAAEALVDVYVVDRMVPKGADAATIRSSISLEKVPARLKQPGAVTSTEVIGTKVAATDLQPGDQLVEARLVAAAAPSAPADKVQISVELEPERAVGGNLKAGDTVGVYLSFDPFELDEAGQASSPGDASTTPDDTAAPAPALPDKSPNMTHLEFQKVLVTSVQMVDRTQDQTATDNVKGDEVPDLTSANTFIVTLALDAEQSERLVFASEFGHVWLSNEPATVSEDGTSLVTLGSVYSVVQP